MNGIPQSLDPRRWFVRILIAIARRRGFLFYARPGDDTLYCDGRFDHLNEAPVLCSFLDQYHKEIIEILQERASRLRESNSFIDSVTSCSLMSGDTNDQMEKNRKIPR